MPQSPISKSPSATAVDAMLERGEGPGRMVVLHAAGSSPRALGGLAAALAGVAGRVLVPSLERGGQSLVGEGAAPFAGAVAMARDLLAAEGPGARILVGHSMGGLIALLALAEGARADAAVLYEPIVLSLLDPADAGDRAAIEWDHGCIAAFRERCTAGDPEAGVAGFIEAYGELPWSALPAPARADLVARAPDLLRQASATNAARLERRSLSGLALPVLVLDGSRSPDVARRMATRLTDALPHVERVTIEGAGHMGTVLRPAAVAAAIEAFLLRRLPALAP